VQDMQWLFFQRVHQRANFLASSINVHGTPSRLAKRGAAILAASKPASSRAAR
jgi:hypothetical protein